MTNFSHEDSLFLAYLRSLSILVIVFGHIGLFWACKPYSEFLHVFIPIFFFISGAVSYSSYCRSVNLSKYYKKRLINLLIPYYLLATFQLLLFIWVNKGVSSLNFSDLIRWLLIIPNNEIMPFSIGHVWFLHTLFVLVLISPFYFHLFRLNEKFAFLIIIFSLFISFVQMFVDISSMMQVFHNNLFKPVVHSCFFMFGVLFFHTSYTVKKRNLVALSFWSLLICACLVNFLSIDIDYEFHTYAPDLYYVSGSFAAIAIMLLCKHILVQVVSVLRLDCFFSFIHRQTYSIYLVHVPVLALWFYFFTLEEAGYKNINYGMLKMLFVVVGTTLFAIPFTRLSSFAIRKTETMLMTRLKEK